MSPDTRPAPDPSDGTPWRCPACLAESRAGEQRCEHCRCSLVLDDRYVILEALASQGPARTLAGIDRHDQTPVVVKTLSVSGLADWKQLELFQRGITVLRGVRHPGIPEHLADGELTRGGETLYFWVQRRVEGRTLAEGLAAGQRWTEARARILADAILGILEYLQGFSPPILHRDVKPSNIMEQPAGDWVLIDFDLVKDTLDPDGSATVALGTAGYAPLEQLMGRAVPASDLYGLGATLVALLSRKSPADLLDALRGRVDFRGHVRISEPFADFIDALLEPQADRRPADASAARLRLRELPDGATKRRPAAGAPVDASGVEAQARRRLLAVLLARARARSGCSSLPEVTRSRALEAVEPAGSPRVRVEVTLIEEHAAPWWVQLTRLAVLGGAAVWIPAPGVVLVVVLLTLWVTTPFVVRYPVRLPPGRALFTGGHGNTSRPGRYWLRRRSSETAFSIDLRPLHLDWRPAPTRIDGTEAPAWLELSLEAWVQPRPDDVGQFGALLRYRLWHDHPGSVAKRLRAEIIAKIVELVDERQVIERAAGRARHLDERALVALDEGLHDLGLVRVALGRCEVRVVPRTEDLSSEDRALLDRRPLPPGAEPLDAS